MESIQPEKKKLPTNKTQKIIFILKTHKKPIIIILAVLLLFLAVTTTLSSIKANKVKVQIENKIFIDGDHVYAFKDGLIAQESWYPDRSEIEGDLTTFERKYRVAASVFSNQIEIQSKYPHGWINTITVYLDDNNSVQLYSYTGEKAENWKEITLEAVEKMRIQKMCDHAFGESVITKVASCTEPGEEKQVCEKCAFEQTQKVYKQHNYVNEICSVCGTKKEAEKKDEPTKEVEKSDIDPNTWYTYNGVLHIQNCLVISATSVSQGRGMMVQYCAVCQHCHAVDKFSKLAGPEVDYEVKKIYYCNECGGQTLVRLKIG